MKKKKELVFDVIEFLDSECSFQKFKTVFLSIFTKLTIKNIH